MLLYSICLYCKIFVFMHFNKLFLTYFKIMYCVIFSVQAGKPDLHLEEYIINVFIVILKFCRNLFKNYYLVCNSSFRKMHHKVQIYYFIYIKNFILPKVYNGSSTSPFSFCNFDPSSVDSLFKISY